MIERLFVVIGAGASRGCAPKDVPTDPVWVPPLVTDLFHPAHLGSVQVRSGTADVIARYPLAKLAAADLRGRGDSLAIEEVIRSQFRDSKNELDRRIFRGIPPYLQELLHEVSYRYTEFPQNYGSLVTNLLRLGEVVFISLNYDVLLDNVLASAYPIKGAGMNWYVDPQRRWSLIKLHGSVNWARNSKVPTSAIFTDPPEDLLLDDNIMLLASSSLWEVRGFQGQSATFRPGSLHYPVLSVPVGRADELVCPPEHVDFLRSKLADTQPLHLLLVGYSGNDREVLSLIRESGRGIATLTIVDHSGEAASVVAHRLRDDHGLEAQSTELHDGDFNSWVESGRLNAYVSEMAERAL